MPKSSLDRWRIKKLSDACSVFTDGDWIEKKDQSDSGIRLIQTGNIGVGNFLNNESRARYISEPTFDRLKCTEVLPGDVLLSRLPPLPVLSAQQHPEVEQRLLFLGHSVGAAPMSPATCARASSTAALAR